LTWRQSKRRLTRRSHGFSKDLPWLEKQLWLSAAYYHLMLPHQSLRQPLAVPEPIKEIRLYGISRGRPHIWGVV